MAYHDRLEAAITWLEGTQRAQDGGWGLAAGQASSIVNTAEALFVLRRGRFYPTSARRGVEFIRSSLSKHLDDPDRGKRVRYVAFALLAFAEYEDFVGKDEIQSCVSWLLDSRNHDNGGATRRVTGTLSCSLPRWQCGLCEGLTPPGRPFARARRSSSA